MASTNGGGGGKDTTHRDSKRSANTSPPEKPNSKRAEQLVTNENEKESQQSLISSLEEMMTPHEEEEIKGLSAALGSATRVLSDEKVTGGVDEDTEKYRKGMIDALEEQIRDKEREGEEREEGAKSSGIDRKNLFKKYLQEVVVPQVQLVRENVQNVQNFNYEDVVFSFSSMVYLLIDTLKAYKMTWVPCDDAFLTHGYQKFQDGYQKLCKDDGSDKEVILNFFHVVLSEDTEKITTDSVEDLNKLAELLIEKFIAMRTDDKESFTRVFTLASAEDIGVTAIGNAVGVSYAYRNDQGKIAPLKGDDGFYIPPPWNLDATILALKFDIDKALYNRLYLQGQVHAQALIKLFGERENDWVLFMALGDSMENSKAVVQVTDNQEEYNHIHNVLHEANAAVTIQNVFGGQLKYVRPNDAQKIFTYFFLGKKDGKGGIERVVTIVILTSWSSLLRANPFTAGSYVAKSSALLAFDLQLYGENVPVTANSKLGVAWDKRTDWKTSMLNC